MGGDVLVNALALLEQKNKLEELGASGSIRGENEQTMFRDGTPGDCWNREEKAGKKNWGLNKAWQLVGGWVDRGE